MVEQQRNSNENVSFAGTSPPDKKTSDTSSPKRNSGSSLLNVRLFERVTKRDLAIFARQLSLLLDLGVTLLRALNILEHRTQNSKLRKIISRIAHSVEQGKQLSDALDEDRNLFGDFFITTVRSGEESGHIENALNQLADYLEKEDFIRSKLKKALSFPLLTMTMAILVVGFLLIYVIPTFAKVYEEAGVELPKITQVIISFSLFLKAFWIPILIALIVFIIFLTRSNRIPGLNRIMDRVKLMFPVIRNITIKTAVYRFARIASTMLDSGVPILTTLKLGAEATENGLFKNSILKACQDIDQGKSVEESLAKHSKFPPMVIDMIGVGEETGQMNVVLRKVAMFYERDVDDAVSNLTTALEPILTLGMGIIVVFIALSMFLPYFNISKVILH